MLSMLLLSIWLVGSAIFYFDDDDLTNTYVCVMALRDGVCLDLGVCRHGNRDSKQRFESWRQLKVVSRNGCTSSLRLAKPNLLRLVCVHVMCICMYLWMDESSSGTTAVMIFVIITVGEHLVRCELRLSNCRGNP